MRQCKECGSYAINPHCHGREEAVDIDLCDVCYWRKRADEYKINYQAIDYAFLRLKYEQFGHQFPPESLEITKGILLEYEKNNPRIKDHVDKHGF